MALSPPEPKRWAHQEKVKKKEKSMGVDGRKNTRFLITVTVLGSAGPLRFVVDEADLVAAVISTVLKSYAREGRRPVLGSDLNHFLLYRANAGPEALSPWERIGSFGSRNFLLCKKQGVEDVKLNTPARVISWKSGGIWKAWLNKSLHLKISSH